MVPNRMPKAQTRPRDPSVTHAWLALALGHVAGVPIAASLARREAA